MEGIIQPKTRWKCQDEEDRLYGLLDLSISDIVCPKHIFGLQLQGIWMNCEGVKSKEKCRTRTLPVDM